MNHRLRLPPIFVALFVLGLIAACARPAPPDPLALYRPAFRAEALPAGFDIAATPRYAIDLAIDPDQRRAEGTARLRFRNHSGRPLNDLFVRLYPNLPQLAGTMQITGVSILPDHLVAGFAYDIANTAARITLPQPLPPGEELELALTYWLQAPDKSGYVLFGQSEGILNLPYSYPMLAAQTRDPASPWRLDVPPPHGDIAIADPSFFWITATVPSNVKLITSGVEITSTAGLSNTVQHILAAGPAREFALTLSRDFQKESLEVDGIRVNSYFLAADAAAGRSALAQAAGAVRVYNRLLAPYPFTELDIVEAPTRYLGMEFPGLNFIGLDTYRQQQETQEVLVAHEVSHQWWYGLVGSDPYRYPWLDEGLAEHSSLLYADTIHGQEAADRMRGLRWQVPAEWAIKNGYDEPVGQDVTAFDGANYEILVYAKSALFFDALDKALGRDAYLKVLQTFIERFRFQTPTPADFLAVVQEVSGADPQPLYQRWILSSPPRPPTPAP
jgi:hypothetical protein